MAFDHCDSTGDFLNRAGKIPLLTADQEIILARKVQRAQAITDANPTGPHTTEETRAIRSGTRAKQRLIEANLRLVVYIARRTHIRHRHSLTQDDLIQEGVIGLTRAVEKFNPERGYKFSTYAYRWVQQSIRRAYTQQAHMIRPPYHIAEMLFSSKFKAQDFVTAHGRHPTTRELAEILGTKPEEIELFESRLHAPASLDTPYGESGQPLGDIIPCDSDHVDPIEELAVDPDVLQAAMDRLDERTKDMIASRYGLGGGDPMSLKDIGAIHDLSRERVRKLVDCGLNRIRMHLNTKQPLHQCPPALEPIPRWVSSKEAAPMAPAWPGVMTF